MEKNILSDTGQAPGTLCNIYWQGTIQILLQKYTSNIFCEPDGKPTNTCGTAIRVQFGVGWLNGELYPYSYDLLWKHCRFQVTHGKPYEPKGIKTVLTKWGYTKHKFMASVLENVNLVQLPAATNVFLSCNWTFSSKILWSRR